MLGGGGGEGRGGGGRFSLLVAETTNWKSVTVKWGLPDLLSQLSFCVLLSVSQTEFHLETLL